jgi:hypothetical protein
LQLEKAPQLDMKSAMSGLSFKKLRHPLSEKS